MPKPGNATRQKSEDFALIRSLVRPAERIGGLGIYFAYRRFSRDSGLGPLYHRQVAPAEPYNQKKFFWWRHFRSLGTGVAGDLFVHLISGIHVITGSQGPDKIYASGQIAYWKDGRDVPDIMTAIMSYPETGDSRISAGHSRKFYQRTG